MRLRTSERIAGCAPLAAFAVLLAASGLPIPSPAAAQEVTHRTPNLSGGWVGEPGTIHFNLLHRFWKVGGGADTEQNLVNSPTMLVAVPLQGRTLLGVQYGSNSLVGGGKLNEWEFFARWAPLSERDYPVGVGVTGAYNTAAGSADGELSLSAPLGPIRVLGALRGFSDARGTGESGWSVAGGAALRLTDGAALAADVGSTWIDGERERVAWGAALQLRIPTTPHSISLQASNTRTGTLQGSSTRRRTVWGFEFTVPITLARYLPRARASTEHTAQPDDDEVEVTMTDALRYVPETLEIYVGQTVVWRNTTNLPHTVTAHPERVRDPALVALPEGAEPFDSGDMFAGDVFRHTFTVAGEYDYICIPHELAGMVGKVVVRARP